jgi:hypothetical protein
VSLKILTNQVWRDACQVLVTDTSDVATAEQDAILSITGGPRHLPWEETSATADRRFVYINKNGGLSADTMVITRADRHQNHDLSAFSWTSYPATKDAEIFGDATFSATLVGLQSQDFVYEFTERTNKQAFGVDFSAGTEGAYQKFVHQIYFCSALTLSYPDGFDYQPLSGVAAYLLRRQMYRVQHHGSLRFNHITRAEVTALEQLYAAQDEPLFVYDSSGYWLRDKLWHCILGQPTKQALGDDHFVATLDLFRLRHP